MESDLTMAEMNPTMQASGSYYSSREALSEIEEEAQIPFQIPVGRVADMDDSMADTFMDKSAVDALSDSGDRSFDIQSAEGRLESDVVSTAPQGNPLDTWQLWPEIEYYAPASMRFITNYAKRHNVPVIS
ncbi:hypothetical protein Dda_2254 [Drechslerella dactyloides]|uniref:Uncharacterized protein n=1 Tax=Drechslerella dactyloides TaxID=74499 RepID=A0AAD6J5J4_DREDA|nr:hypothetical protein Dda_2254 [Drechslerella dactyloides]